MCFCKIYEPKSSIYFSICLWDSKYTRPNICFEMVTTPFFFILQMLYTYEKFQQNWIHAEVAAAISQYTHGKKQRVLRRSCSVFVNTFMYTNTYAEAYAYKCYQRILIKPIEKQNKVKRSSGRKYGLQMMKRNKN